MPSKSKSIFRQPGARHFQLVHRSQRDPLVHDPEASSHVLKPIVKGKSIAELEKTLSPDELAHDLGRANIGEASLYGVYYDDTEYDYMQHFREVGRRGDGAESVLIEAPTTSKHTGKKDKAHNGISLLDLPSEALPSEKELSLEQTYDTQRVIPAELQGLQPDMNPHLRQTLEALEDDAFVDDSLADDFFSELVDGGELEGGAGELDFEYREEGVDEGSATEREDTIADAKTTNDDEDEGWQARFARFKMTRETKVKEEDVRVDEVQSDMLSEGGDTVGQLPQISVIGGKKRGNGASSASGYSMSSSSMFRNEGLTLLDERFDEIEKKYEDDEGEGSSEESDEAPDLITSREDFNAIMDDFLDNYEIIAGRMRPVLPGKTVTDKLGTIRQSLKGIASTLRVRLEEDEEESDDAFEDIIEGQKECWDCETILSTYSNLENHPKLIRVRETAGAPKINLDPKSGLPSSRPSIEKPEFDSLSEKPVRVTVARNKGETKEEKRARKHAVKEERQARRAAKKTTQDLFAIERKQQMTTLSMSRKGVRTL